MRPILALRHVPHETMGSLEGIFRHAGLVYSYVNLYEETPRNFNADQLAGLVVLGGPMNVDETHIYPYLASEIEWIGQALEAEVPLLGICLGSQLLAKALGAKVYPNRIKEIGWYQVDMTPAACEDPLFAECGESETVFQWHGDTFDLPVGAVQLARSELCEQQAFRWGDSAYGLQFHVEITTEMIFSWLAEVNNCIELAELDYIDADEIRSSAPELVPDMQATCERMFTRFAEFCLERAVINSK